MAQACLESSLRYTRSRKQFGARLREHQLIKRMITDMAVDIEAARALCYQAGVQGETDDRQSFELMLMAKYFTSNMAVRVTGNAVQIHGANGYTRDYSVERFFRDAKIMQMIEGSNEMLQIMISRYAYKGS
jgi:glutaryl-CoA dehydrogenase (non-decarboxylating)